jgi:hypothetical protein
MLNFRLIVFNFSISNVIFSSVLLGLDGGDEVENDGEEKGEPVRHEQLRLKAHEDVIPILLG